MEFMNNKKTFTFIILIMYLTDYGLWYFWSSASTPIPVCICESAYTALKHVVFLIALWCEEQKYKSGAKQNNESATVAGWNHIVSRFTQYKSAHF